MHRSVYADMLSLVELLNFNCRNFESYSSLVDVQQIYIRNLFIFCFSLSIARQLFGENIVCHTMGQSLSPTFVNTHCFINGTMTRRDSDNDQHMYHSYYQWVSIYLLLLAFSFYFPFSVWCHFNKHYLNELTKKMDSTKKCLNLFQVIQSSKGNFLFQKTWGLECIYLVHLILHIWFTDIFFNNAWTKIGWWWTTISNIFPENGVCYITYFSGGGETSADFKCLLPLNSVYRKIFSMLYVIIILLCISNIITFMYRIRQIKRIGWKRMDVWWATMVAANEVEEWVLKNTLLNCLNRYLERGFVILDTYNPKNDHFFLEIEKNSASSKI